MAKKKEEVVEKTTEVKVVNPEDILIENEKKELENNKSSLDTAKQTKESKAQALTVAKKEKQEKHLNLL